MEHHEESTPNYSEVGPTYKALFLGACFIIGSTFGWWLTNFIYTVESLHTSYERRLAELETRALRETWERDALRSEMDDLRKKGKL
jgi:hypothetical protein